MITDVRTPGDLQSPATATSTQRDDDRAEREQLQQVDQARVACVADLSTCRTACDAKLLASQQDAQRSVEALQAELQPAFWFPDNERTPSAARATNRSKSTAVGFAAASLQRQQQQPTGTFSLRPPTLDKTVESPGWVHHSAEAARRRLRPLAETTENALSDHFRAAYGSGSGTNNGSATVRRGGFSDRKSVV